MVNFATFVAVTFTLPGEITDLKFSKYPIGRKPNL